MKRLWHLLIYGHNWRLLSAAYNKPQEYYLVPRDWDSKQAVWGFTEIILRCDCGALKTRRVIGDHSGMKAALELAELERTLR